jgi:tRNA threonylcarbamoyladenosine biosynthesis protein TsaE
MTAEDTRGARSVAETERIGEALGAGLVAGDVVLLTGPLGAGKTRFVAGLARGLGCKARVRSPSFAIVNQYRGTVPLLHVDLYRLEGRAAEDLGLEEQLEEAVLACEWGERLPDRLTGDALTLTFEAVSETERAIRATSSGDRGLELLMVWRVLDDVLATLPARAAEESAR